MMPDTSHDQVIVREEQVTIPTYRIGQPEKNPMFLEKRIYQGSSGVVYPHPIVERVFSEKEDKQYTALFLENRYLKFMLLPELGGRVQMALDKTNGYHFVYYNQVIKPALVGLTGPWLSGGIEFNWPQHHRPSTFQPVDYKIEASDDGSKTVWFSEIERMFRTRGTAAFTLYPDQALLEIKVQLYNRTSEPQSFLWWANPAVHVNDDYQSIFPPDVHAVMDHGKRDVSTFPIATGTYYKMDYSPGTDISRYKNIPVPTSYMAYHSDFDFLGCYDHGRQAGMMHIANHHVVPGKKQWTWGNSDFGQAWDRQLTDEDGPYIELMCGAYTDNQPDFSWLQPGEEKRFTQTFMPYKQIGAAKNASREAVVNLEIEGDVAKIGVYLSRPHTVTVELTANAQILFRREVLLDPTTVLVESIQCPTPLIPHQLTLRVLDGKRELITFTPLPDKPSSIPSAATAAKRPSEIDSNEGLFLNGLHLEQYRHATYEPEPYYREALRRDPADSRCKNAMGLLLFRRGKFAEAELYFRKAVESLTRRNPNPYEGEAYYNLGLALRMQQRYSEAFDAFYKATWNAAWRDSSYFELARLACRGGQFDEALDLLDRSLARNQHHHKARHLKIAVLRRLGCHDKAISEIADGLELDGFNFGALYERFLLGGDAAYQKLMRDYVYNYIETALDYAHSGLFREAIDLISEAPTVDPMAKYYLGWFHVQKGDLAAADAVFSEARTLPPDYCFPNEIECVPVLQAAMQRNPADSRAPYYLGLFWYAHRRYAEAIECWEQSRERDSSFPTVHRNLGLAYMNKLGDTVKAKESYDTAFVLNQADARVFFELDQLDKKQNQPPRERLQRLEQQLVLVEQRDDLMIERITLLNLSGRHEEALDLLRTHEFHPWEGGEGKVIGQYVIGLVELAKRQLQSGNFNQAVELLQRAQAYPHNLGEGKLPGAQENNIHYFLGCAYQGLGDMEQAHHYFSKAATGLMEPSSPMFYNDQPPEMIFYQGRALEKLGRQADATILFQKLVDYGTQHLTDVVVMDYFAVSLPDFLVFDEDLSLRNQIHCHYMMALGYSGLKQNSLANHHFQQVSFKDGYHFGIFHLA